MAEANIAKQITEESEEQIVSNFMSGILPKIAPMMKQANKDFSDYLSGKDDGEEKTIVIKMFKGRPPSVMVLGNKGRFHVQCDGEKGMSIFKADKTTVQHMFTAEEFVELLLSGKIKK